MAGRKSEKTADEAGVCFPGVNWGNGCHPPDSFKQRSGTENQTHEI